jgi:hypothetical protein
VYKNECIHAAGGTATRQHTHPFFDFFLKKNQKTNLYPVCMWLAQPHAYQVVF